MNEINSNLDGVMGQMSSNSLLQPKLTQTSFAAVSQGSQHITRKPLSKITTMTELSKTNNTVIQQPIISTVRPRITGGNLIRTTEEKMRLENQNPNPNNSTSGLGTCPDGYTYSAKNKICYKCPQGYSYNEDENACYQSDNGNTDGNGGYMPETTPQPSEAMTAEGGYATENATVEEPKVEEKVMKKVDKKYYWYAGLAIGLFAIAYLLKKSK